MRMLQTWDPRTIFVADGVDVPYGFKDHRMDSRTILQEPQRSAAMRLFLSWSRRASIS
jgi:hypothetical protein